MRPKAPDGWAVYDSGHPVSASLQVTPGAAGGEPLFLVAGRGIEALSGRLERRPFRFRGGSRPFASTPAIAATPGGHATLVGCDDGSLYADAPLGPEGGGPWVTTGLDIYSSPVVSTRAPGASKGFVAFGSDDGHVYAVDMKGAPLPGYPVACGHFVSATPCVGDFDGDGAPEILVGDWSGHFHALRLDGTELNGFPVNVGISIWSSATMADIDGDGRPEAVFATRRLHALRPDGSAVPGFPRLLGSYAVSSPTVVDFDGSGRASILVGSDRLYCFDGAGNERPGFPVALDGYLWSSSVTAKRRGSSDQAAFAGTWGGGFHQVDSSGASRRLLSCGAPIFATAALMPDGPGSSVLAVASWDGLVHASRLEGWEVTESAWPTLHRTPTNARENPHRFAAPAGAPAAPDPEPAGGAPAEVKMRTQPPRPRHRRAVFLRFQGLGFDGLEKAQVVYRIAGEGREHPTPLLVEREGAVALVQPLGVGRRVALHLEGKLFGGATWRFPTDGELGYTVEQWGPLRIGRLVAALEGAK